MPTIDEVRPVVEKVLLAEGTLSAGVEVSDNLAFNVGDYRIASLSFIRAFILLEDELDIEFGDDALMQNTFATFGDVSAFVAAEVDRQRG